MVPTHSGGGRSTAPDASSWICACAHCGRIRRRQGWRTARPGECAGATLTHDICPDCIRKLYPRYARIAKHLQEAEAADPPAGKQKTQTL